MILFTKHLLPSAPLVLKINHCVAIYPQFYLHLLCVHFGKFLTTPLTGRGAKLVSVWNTRDGRALSRNHPGVLLYFQEYILCKSY